jgi:hypothetical protein
MKDNKIALVSIGFIATFCICLTVAFLGVGGYFIYDEMNSPVAQATIPPGQFPSPLPPETGEPYSPTDVSERDENPTIDDLSRIAVIPTSYSMTTGGDPEGVAIDIVYYGPNDQVITFDGVPVDITIELFAFDNFFSSSDLTVGEKVYEGSFTMDHSSTLEEMFDNYIRIPYDEIAVAPNTHVRFGSAHVIVEAPNGTFEDVSTLVVLYPEQEE